MSFKWTDEKIAIATNMVKAGKSAKELSSAIGCKKSCAYNFIQRIVPEEVNGDFKPFVVKKRGKKPKDKSALKHEVRTIFTADQSLTKVAAAQMLSPENKDRNRQFAGF